MRNNLQLRSWFWRRAICSPIEPLSKAAYSPETWTIWEKDKRISPENPFPITEIPSLEEIMPELKSFLFTVIAAELRRRLSQELCHTAEMRDSKSYGQVGKEFSQFSWNRLTEWIPTLANIDYWVIECPECGHRKHISCPGGKNHKW